MAGVGAVVGFAGDRERGELAANVAAAEPSVIARVITAWPSFALIGSYELLMRQVRWVAFAGRERPAAPPVAEPRDPAVSAISAGSPKQSASAEPGADLRGQARRWALANLGTDGLLPTGR